jgi:predicted transposase/invertase (TIGR01784 family)
MCKINPRVDFAFKKLFGSEENTDLLMSLINAIVSSEEQVVEDERLIYELRMQSLADVESKIASAEEKGIEQGANLATKKIALNLAKAGTTIAVIAAITGLSEAILNELLNE